MWGTQCVTLEELLVEVLGHLSMAGGQGARSPYMDQVFIHHHKYYLLPKLHRSVVRGCRMDTGITCRMHIRLGLQRWIWRVHTDRGMMTSRIIEAIDCSGCCRTIFLHRTPLVLRPLSAPRTYASAFSRRVRPVNALPWPSRTPLWSSMHHQNCSQQGACTPQARASGKEDAVASMQAFKAGLAKALASREESLRAGDWCPGACLGCGTCMGGSLAQGILQALRLQTDGSCCCTDVGVKAAAVEPEPATTSGLREITCDDFHSFIQESNNAGRLVLVDFYTDW